jgi:hypothetical protein
MDSDREKRESLFAEYQKEIFAREQSNSQSLDRAILTLSTAILGLSLAFIRDKGSAVDLSSSQLLIWSWVLFCAAIASTLISFSVSKRALKRQRGYAYNYYIKDEREFIDKPNPLAKLVDLLNIFSSAAFIIGMILTIIFVSTHLNTGGKIG